jgi:class 3 adenylate cyclase
MEPDIRYCKTRDGVSIAYYAIGEGPAVMQMGPIPFRHIRFQWEAPSSLDQQIAAFLTQRRRTFVQFDARGLGSSSRSDDFSLEAFVSDLEAVANELGDEPFDLVATSYSCPIAIAYAARHQERVAHLVLSQPFVNGAEALDTTTGRAIRALRGQSWDVYVDTAFHVIFRGDRSVAELMARIMRESASPEVIMQMYEAVDRFDVDRYLADVVTPTLVLSVPDPLVSLNQTRQVAARIRGAQFVTDDVPRLVAAGRFFGILDPTEDVTQSTSTTTIILFADIVDSTALTERMGDAVFRERARALDASLRGTITSGGGTPIDGKLLGDGVLATFPAAAQAIDAALRCSAAGNDGGLPLHLGIHAGDVIREQNNVFGGAVNIASRISGLSAPGEVLVSDVVRALARTSASVTFEDRGEHTLKGVGEPQRVYAVRSSGAS